MSRVKYPPGHESHTSVAEEHEQLWNLTKDNSQYNLRFFWDNASDTDIDRLWGHGANKHVGLHNNTREKVKNLCATAGLPDIDVDTYFLKTKSLSGQLNEPGAKDLAAGLTEDFQEILTYTQKISLSQPSENKGDLPAKLQALKYAIFADIYGNGPRTNSLYFGWR